MRRAYIFALAATAGIVLLIGGYFLYSDYLQKNADARQQKALEDARKLQQQLALDKKRDEDANWNRALALIQAPAQLSPWLEKDKKLFTDIIRLAKSKILVIPPTVPADAPGIDITGRVTMARQLAALLEAETGEIPDPGLVYRALGELRTISIDEIRRRLEPTLAQWLIVGSAQHDGKGRMRISLTKVPMQRPAGAEPPPAFDRDGIEIGGPRTPELQFKPLAAEAARALGYKVSEMSRVEIAINSALVLPMSPSDSVKFDEKTQAGVWMQQLVGVLHVPYWEALPRPQERVFERTLAALLGAPQQAPDNVVLMARALAYLNRREAALKVLAEGSGTPEEKALSAYLLADLPALGAAIAQIKRPAAKLISELELLSLRNLNDLLPQKDAQLELRRLANSVPDGWKPLVAIHVLGLSLWTMASPANVKLVLDHDFPLAGYSTQDILRGKAALGATDIDERTKVELHLSPLIHARRWREANMNELCCRTGATSWARFQLGQYLDLLETDADRLVVARLEFLSRVQDLPDQMERLANVYDQVLFDGGHSGVVHQRIVAAIDAFRKTTGDSQARVAVDAFENSRKILTWESTQGVPTYAATLARNYFYSQFLASRGSSPGRLNMQPLPQHDTELDYPMRWIWAMNIGSATAASNSRFALETARDACVNTIASFQACANYVDVLKKGGRKVDVEQAVKTLIEPRFNGIAKRIELLASIQQELGNSDATRELLRRAVTVPNAPMYAYSSLGDFLRREGDFASSAEVYLSYPGLKNRKEDPVGISNYIGNAGSYLAARGAIKEARPLLELAASNRDGSHNSMRAAGQLALMDGDYQKSLAIFQTAYQRYKDPRTTRVIASILFMLGEPDAAWSALRDILPATVIVSPYRAVPVGMRIGAYDESAMLTWRDEALQRAAAGARLDPLIDYADIGLFQTLLMDRGVDAFSKIFYMTKPIFVLHAPPGPVAAKDARVPPVSRYGISGNAQHFLRAYLAFKENDHAGATQAWDPLVKSFDDMSFPPRFAALDDTFWAGMQYFAISLAKTGRLAEARQLPERLTREGRPVGSPKVMDGVPQLPMPEFDRKMIAGIAEAFAGNHAQALQFLRGAQGSMAEPGARLIPPEYAFVEILAFLGKETSDQQYIQLALAFARAFRQYEPWAAWSYAFEAVNSPQSADRIRAAALALKLDTKSSWLKRLDAKELEQAREALSRSNPFRIKPPVKERES